MYVDTSRSHVSGGVFPTAQDRKKSKMLNDPYVQDDRTRACYVQTGLWQCCVVWSKRVFNSEASNGATFGGSPNNATSALRPSARHALPYCASLAAGPMANQLQDSSVDLPRVTRSRARVHYLAVHTRVHYLAVHSRAFGTICRYLFVSLIHSNCLSLNLRHTFFKTAFEDYL